MRGGFFHQDSAADLKLLEAALISVFFCSVYLSPLQINFFRFIFFLCVIKLITSCCVVLLLLLILFLIVQTAVKMYRGCN